jgi:hypothetical protein
VNVFFSFVTALGPGVRLSFDASWASWVSVYLPFVIELLLSVGTDRLFCFLALFLKDSLK